MNAQGRATEGQTWFADVKVHGSPHVEDSLDDGFGQSRGREENRSSPLGPLGRDGAVGNQVQFPAQLIVWVSSICLQQSSVIHEQEVGERQVSHFTHSVATYITVLCLKLGEFQSHTFGET